MKKLGKQGKINIKARKKIAEICEGNNWNTCLLFFPGCLSEASAPAHRHERAWYKGKPEQLLWDLLQWIPACQNCHDMLDKNKKKRELIFITLRGEENL